MENKIKKFYTKEVYEVTYKGDDYIYISEYDINVNYEDTQLMRFDSDPKPISDELEDEIMDYINEVLK